MFFNLKFQALEIHRRKALFNFRHLKQERNIDWMMKLLVFIDLHKSNLNYNYIIYDTYDIALLLYRNMIMNTNYCWKQELFFALTVTSRTLPMNDYVADSRSGPVAPADDPVKGHVKCVGAVIWVLSTEGKNASVASLASNPLSFVILT